jgi:hypothetical protein
MVKVKLVDGRKLKGRFAIMNDSTIRIKNCEFAINDMVSIQKKPMSRMILGTVFIVVPLIEGIAMDIMLMPLYQAYLPIGTVAATPFVTAGILMNTIGSRHKTKKGWEYQIIE